jgi:hypothetical protein
MIRKITAIALLGSAIFALTLALGVRLWTPVEPSAQLTAEFAFQSARFSDLFQ